MLTLKGADKRCVALTLPMNYYRLLFVGKQVVCFELFSGEKRKQRTGELAKSH